MSGVHLPAEIISEILIRLQPKPLLRFRSVCKAWRHIIDDDDPVLSLSHADSLVFYKDNNLHPIPLYFLNCPENVKPEATIIYQAIPGGKVILPGLIASCHGLILILDALEWRLWNPFTNDCLTLPYFLDSLTSWHDGVDKSHVYYGVGYDCVNNDYKAVRVSRNLKTGVFTTLIYSKKSGTWRRIEDGRLDSSDYWWYNLPGVHLHGVLHWISGPSIITLDLSSETYLCKLRLPFGLGTEKYLCVLDGCLCYSCYTSDVKNRFSVWILQDSASGATWTRLIRLKDFDHETWHLKPVAYMKSERQIVLKCKNSFFWFDVDGVELVKTVSIHEPYVYCGVLPSLLGLIAGQFC